MDLPISLCISIEIFQLSGPLPDPTWQSGGLTLQQILLLGGPQKAQLSFLVPWIYFLGASKLTFLTVYPLYEVHRPKLLQ